MIASAKRPQPVQRGQLDRAAHTDPRRPRGRLTQTQLDLLVHEHQRFLASETDARPDFSGLDLTGLSLRGRSLSGACLQGANLTGVDLEGAILSHVKARNARFERANLQGADLSDSDFSSVVFRYAQGQRADFSGSLLHGANLGDADWSDADFSDTYLVAAMIHRSNLERADFCNADLSYTSIEPLRLTGARFHAASLYTVIGLDFVQLSLALRGEPTFLTAVLIDGTPWVSTDNHWGKAANVRQLLEEEAQANDRSQVLAALDFALSRLQPTVSDAQTPAA